MEKGKWERLTIGFTDGIMASTGGQRRKTDLRSCPVGKLHRISEPLHLRETMVAGPGRACARRVLPETAGPSVFEKERNGQGCSVAKTPL